MKTTEMLINLINSDFHLTGKITVLILKYYQLTLPVYLLAQNLLLNQNFKIQITFFLETEGYSLYIVATNFVILTIFAVIAVRKDCAFMLQSPVP